MIWFIKGIWIVLVNLFVLPVLMYGANMYPDTLDGRFGAHVLVTIIVAIYINNIIDTYVDI